MLKLLPTLNFNTEANTKCGEIFCHNSADFTVYCTLCEMKSFCFEDFLQHVKGLHFANDAFKPETTSQGIYPKDSLIKMEAEEYKVYDNVIQSYDNFENDSNDTDRGDNDKVFDDEPLAILREKQQKLRLKVQDITCFESDKSEEDFNNLKSQDYLPASVETDHSCHMCEETFKTAGHLKAHFDCTHGEEEEFKQIEYEEVGLEEDDKADVELVAPTQNVKPKTDQIKKYPKSNPVDNSAGRKYLLYDKIVATIVDYAPDGTPVMEFSESNNKGDKTLHMECGICTDVMKRSEIPAHLKTHLASVTNRYHCIYCDETYKDFRILAGHARRHRGIRPYACKQCNLYFATKTEINAHNQRHHQEKDYICKVCGKGFAGNGELKRHREAVHEKIARRFKCDICRKSYCNNFILEEHKTAVHMGKRRTRVCVICGIQCRDPRELAQHRKQYHLHQTHFECKICNEVFTNIKYFDVHRRSALCNTRRKQQKAQLQKESKEANFELVEPVKIKIEARKYMLYDGLIATIIDYNPDGTPIVELSMSNVEGDKKLPKECGICPDVMDRSEISAHLKTHLVPGTNRYKCIYCDETSKYYKILAGHARRHMGIRPHVCELCKLSFSTKQDLGVHNHRRHPKKKDGKEANLDLVVPEQNVKTKIETRKYMLYDELIATIVDYDPDGTPILEFSVSNNEDDEMLPMECGICPDVMHRSKILAHLKKHLVPGTNLYKCIYCDETYKNLRILLGHARHHMGIRPYVCELCKLNFPTKQHLGIHNHRRHPKKKEVTESNSELVVPKQFVKTKIDARKYMLYDELIATIVDYDPDGTPILEFSVSNNEDDEMLPKECGICPDVMDRSKISAHLKTHLMPGTNRYKCIYCDETSKNYKMLAGHARRHMGIRPYVCELCKLNFPTKQHLGVHDHNRHPEKNHICKVCGKTFAETCQLRRHREVVHGKRQRLKCDICPKSYLRNFDLEDHRRVVHMGKPRIKVCRVCGIQCRDAREMARHRKQYHLHQTHFECNICNKQFTNIKHFDAHKRSTLCRSNTRRKQVEEGLLQQQQEEQELVHGHNQQQNDTEVSEQEMLLEDDNSQQYSQNSNDQETL